MSDKTTLPDEVAGWLRYLDYESGAIPARLRSDIRDLIERLARENEANDSLAEYHADHADRLMQRIEEQKAEFQRMESAWRSELESWYRGEPNNPSHPSLLASLNEKLKKAERQLHQALRWIETKKQSCRMRLLSNAECCGLGICGQSVTASI